MHWRLLKQFYMVDDSMVGPAYYRADPFPTEVTSQLVDSKHFPVS